MEAIPYVTLHDVTGFAETNRQLLPDDRGIILCCNLRHGQILTLVVVFLQIKEGRLGLCDQRIWEVLVDTTGRNHDAA